MYTNLLICGEIGVGKSTLVSLLAEKAARPLYGFISKSLNARDDGYHEIYMYPPFIPGEKQLLAICNGTDREVYSEVFDDYGVRLLENVGNDGIVIMDEIGFMEESSPKFKEKILEILDSDLHVIAAVKSAHHDTEFLQKVRNHSNSALYYITRENRDELTKKLLEDFQL